MLKTEAHCDQILAVNLQDFCQALCSVELYLGCGKFCYDSFSDGQR